MYRTAVLRLAVVLGLLGAGTVTGCGGIDGRSGHFPGTVVYESPSGDYHFHLLEPPWIPLTVLGEALFVVPASLKITEATLTEADALYTLRIDRLDGSAQGMFELRHQGVEAMAPESVTVRQSALDLSWRQGAEAYYRDAYFQGATPDVAYVMSFTSQRPLAADPMILSMILSFEPVPASAHEISP